MFLVKYSMRINISKYLFFLTILSLNLFRTNVIAFIDKKTSKVKEFKEDKRSHVQLQKMEN